ncbi:hypothetical protein Tco_0073365 [Tanacetum coccineum]
MQVMPLSSNYEVGGSSTAAVEGHSLTLLAPGVPVPPSVIKDLCTRKEGIGYKVMASQIVQVVNGLEQGQQAMTQKDETITLVAEMSSRESTLMQCILGMDRRLADLERRPSGPQ